MRFLGDFPLKYHEEKTLIPRVMAEVAEVMTCLKKE